MRYRVEYSPEAVVHLRCLTPRDQATVLDEVLRSLVHEPTAETRNRKPMRPNPLAPWELRVGGLRVYYDVVDLPEPVVLVRAIGIKDRNRVLIAGEVIDL